MKKSNIEIIKYYRLLIDNGWIEPLQIMKKIQQIDAEIKITKNVYKRNILTAQKRVLEESLR